MTTIKASKLLRPEEPVTPESATQYPEKPSECQSRALHDDKYPEFAIYFNRAEHALHFIVLEISGWGESGSYMFGGDNVPGVPSNPEVPDDASRFMHGTVKWDGCIDFDVGEGTSYQLHFCGHENARLVGKAIDAIYELARTIPAWNEECGS